jgi:UDP-N-acetylmuramyl pentapeptide phosphotransferase/UDP-N-acetylglucosamine-1-phosphate transferase
MFHTLPPYILYLIAALSSALISGYSVRKILYITRNRKIYDLPDDTRKIHGAKTPSLGGIGIFIGYIMTALIFWPPRHLPVNYFLPSTVLLFFTGVYDDLMNMRSYKKLVAQLLASVITIYLADIRITSFYGLAGIETLPYWISLLITVVGCALFINAFNFIDGIDGLACSLSILYSCILGLLFAPHHEGLAALSFCVAGATAGLLVYNYSPAKIYMGDTGSMLLGFTLFILSIVFLNVCAADQLYSSPGQTRPFNEMIHSDRGAFIIMVSLLFFPVFDAIRVFILRLSKGRSPLKADRSHIHFYLLDAGIGHTRSVLILLVTNILIIASAFLMQDYNSLLTLLCMTILAILSLIIIFRFRQKQTRKETITI